MARKFIHNFSIHGLSLSPSVSLNKFWEAASEGRLLRVIKMIYSQILKGWKQQIITRNRWTDVRRRPHSALLKYHMVAFVYGVSVRCACNGEKKCFHLNMKYPFELVLSTERVHHRQITLKWLAPPKK